MEDVPAKGMRLPPYILWIIGISLVPIVSWCTFVTMTAFETRYRGVIQDVNTQKINVLEKQYGEIVINMKVVEATRFTAEDGEKLTLAISTRIDRLEVKFDAMRRDLDRAGVGVVKSP